MRYLLYKPGPFSVGSALELDMIRKSLFFLFIITMVAVITSTGSVFAQSMTSVQPFKVGTFAIDDVPTVGLVVHDDKLIVDLAAANRALELMPEYSKVSMPDDMTGLISKYEYAKTTITTALSVKGDVVYVC